jgi:hypothetical protein
MFRKRLVADAGVVLAYSDREDGFRSLRPEITCEEDTAMRPKHLIVLLLVAALGAGCSASQLQARKENAWSSFPSALPDDSSPNANGYAHPLRAAAFVLHPIGVALDYVLVRPFYLLAGLAPQWFGLSVDDAQKYQQHMPELVAPKTAPQRFQNLAPVGGGQP